MRAWTETIALGLIVACSHSHGPSSDSGQVDVADLVLTNGKVVTLEDDLPIAEAVAIQGPLILAVGSAREIDAFIGDGTRVIDLRGQLATPGWIEGHGHYMSFGRSLAELELRHTANWDEVVEIVRAAVDAARPGDWIVGRGWHQGKWNRSPSPSVEGLPTHGSLSAVSPENPVMLVHTSGHAVFVNELTMEIVGIDDRTPNPPGGEIVRDASRQAIGMLRESSQDVVRAALEEHLAQRPPAEIEAWLRDHVWRAGEETIRNGITSFQDMGTTFSEIDLLKTMADEGNLPVRLFMAIEEESDVMAERLADYRMINYGNGFLTVRTIGEKVLDGALGTHGGWLLEPYADLPRSHGLNVVPVAEIERSAELALVHGYQMAIQGIGDRAVRELFRIYDTAFKKHPEKSDWRWRIEHAQVVHPDDLPKFADLGVIPGVQGIFACSDGIWVEERLGETRTRERGYVFRTMADSGAVVMNGTDPPVEDIDPIASFHCSVTRRLADGSVFLPEQRLSREQALRSYTINNAYAAFEEDFKGSLSPGKWADITVFSKDLLTIPDDEILSTQIAYTIIGGEVRYEGRRSDGPPAGR